jgi:hypothetical protein
VFLFTLARSSRSPSISSPADRRNAGKPPTVNTFTFFSSAVNTSSRCLCHVTYSNARILDMFASLLLPCLSALACDWALGKRVCPLDGINLHVQSSAPILIYTQFLIWMGIFFAPLLPILSLINLVLSFVSHHVYLLIRSSSFDGISIGSSEQLQHAFYLLNYVALIVSVTTFSVFTTQAEPSSTCGPFATLETPYNAIELYTNKLLTSALWDSIVSFLTSPGLIYFIGVVLISLIYKLREEALAAKQVSRPDEKSSTVRHCCLARCHTREHVGKQETYSTTARQPTESKFA